MIKREHSRQIKFDNLFCVFSEIPIAKLLKSSKHMLRADGFLLLLVADVVAFTGDEVDELCATVEHQLPSLVGNPDVWQELLDHLVHGRPGDGQLVILLWLTRCTNYPPLIHVCNCQDQVRAVVKYVYFPIKLYTKFRIQ